MPAKRRRVMQTARYCVGSPLPTDSVPVAERHDATRSFALVSHNLAQIGSIPLERFLSDNTANFDRVNLAAFRIHTRTPTPPFPTESRPIQLARPMTTASADTANNVQMDPVTRLQKACQCTFGSTDALKFEFLEEGGAQTKQCILTITRPDDSSRSYSTTPTFLRKVDAKISAASIAIEMGALKFIVTGNSDPTTAKRGGLVLAPLDAPNPLDYGEDLQGDPAIQEIENCCGKWRAGRVKPVWVTIHKSENKHGCALKIELSLHSSRVYSTDTIYDNAFRAKQECAKIALYQGVLDFIKYGNGQIRPAAGPSDGDGKMAASTNTELTLQSFYETLPRPFPEPVGNKTAAEVNAPAWLNTTIQSARGGKLSSSFFLITNATLSLHGCILRIEHCGESKSYLVDARFSKRNDAKAAVCLQAMSQGLGNYIRAVGKEVDSRVTQEMRKLANEQIYPTILSETSKLGQNAHPTYEYERDKDAFGCTMRVAPFAAPDEIREYRVPAEYRTKADAKISAVLLAVEQGVVEFLRFRGAPAPPRYIPILASRCAEILHHSRSRKRKEMDRRDADEGQTRRQRKKRKKNGNKNDEQDPVTRQVPHPLPTRPNPSRKNPHVPGSGGLVPMSGLVQAGHPIGQTRDGPRDVGSSTLAGSSIDGSQDHCSGDVLTPPVFQGSIPLYAQMPGTRPEFQGEWGAPYSSYVHHPSFSGGVYPQTSSDQSGTPQFLDPDHAAMSNIGYIPPYGTAAGPSQYTHYSSSQYPPHFQPPSYYPESPQVVYAAGTQNYSHVSLSQYSHDTSLPPGPSSVGMHDNVRPGAPSASSSRLVNEQSNIKRGYSAERDSEYSEKEVGNSYRRQTESSYFHQNSDQTWGGPSFTPPPTRAENGDTMAMGASRESRRKSGAGPKANGLRVPKKSVTRQRDPSRGRPFPDKRRSMDADGKLIITVERAPTSHVTALLDFCDSNGLSRPQFHQEVVKDREGNNAYKVWMVLGSERFELPTTFSNVRAGQERVAKQVLAFLRTRAKKGTRA